MKKIIISGGGTGGHVIPALAVAKELKKLDFEILYIGNEDSIEQKMLKNTGFKFEAINVQKLYRKFTFAHFKFPYLFLKSIYDCWKIFSEFQPDAYLGTGGFVSGPAGIVAKLKRVPIYLHEQNSFPGLTNRKIGRFATSIFLGNNGAAHYFEGKRTLYVGNPINPSVVKYDKIDPESIGLSRTTVKIFLVGGSQGSYTLNKYLLETLSYLLDHNYEIIWQVGKYSFNEFKRKVGNMQGVHLFDFSENIGAYYELADLAIARAGALTLAELETRGIPTLLIPLPNSAGNHQFFNAQEFVDKKLGMLLEQKNLHPQTLRTNIEKLYSNLDSFNENFKPAVHITAAGEIANNLNRYIK